MQQATNESDGQTAVDGTDLRRELAAADPAEHEDILAETVRELASTVLEQPGFAPDSNFLENGLTSLRAMKLINELHALTGVEVPLVALIEHPTPVELGRFVAEALAETAA